MRIGGAVVGVLALDYGGPRHDFLPHEVALAQAVAQLAAMVFERDRLLQQRDRLLQQREAARARELALLTINQHMDDFLSMAAHDLKSPVAGAKLVAQTSQRRVRRLVTELGAANPEAQRHGTQLERALENVTEQMNRLTRLVDRLLDVSRARTGNLEIEPEPCDLAATVRECVEQQRAITPARRITLDLPGNGAVPLTADALRIGQVLTNYLTNAARYSEPEMPICVSLTVEPERVRVAVRDNGPGIPADDRESIWSRFERAKGVKQHAGTDTGLGLGLYISRSIIERHGGTVGVESEEGCGSTFWFTLPLPV
jgi:signal transduction histidine kinase